MLLPRFLGLLTEVIGNKSPLGLVLYCYLNMPTINKTYLILTGQKLPDKKNLDKKVPHNEIIIQAYYIFLY